MKEDDFDDHNDDELILLGKKELVEIIMTLRKEIDELKGMKRNSEGEMIIPDEEVVDDYEEVVT